MASEFQALLASQAKYWEDINTNHSAELSQLQNEHEERIMRLHNEYKNALVNVVGVEDDRMPEVDGEFLSRLNAQRRNLAQQQENLKRA
eukprot:CAMPEP_0177687748 /NCGR_PEP_ID=MMETSP0447-20121125/34298_1 /TAXON_ID=0 /ORGANISM="Stygamoeba regulata, Strain BSH-02190019" /LENGTH=88 /DNA_ID=CAMNT_0019198019 /DNA_START=51 /DNA_END=314 /DNA_ORIENTATION=+